MAEQKSYNAEYLKGDTEYDDKQFQADYKELGVNIPDSLLYTPEMNLFVAKAEKEKTKVELVGKLNPQTLKPFSEEEVNHIAEQLYKTSLHYLN
jgi:hypothetical protein